MPDRFFILSLPRSRTAWLSNLLSSDRGRCYHEGFLHCDGLNDYLRIMSDEKKLYVGDSNSAWIGMYDALIRHFIDARFLVVLRSPFEVLTSLSKITQITGAIVEVIKNDHQKLLMLSNSYPTISFNDFNDFDLISDRLNGLSKHINMTPDKVKVASQFNIQRNGLHSDFDVYCKNGSIQIQKMKGVLKCH